MLSQSAQFLLEFLHRVPGLLIEKTEVAWACGDCLVYAENRDKKCDPGQLLPINLKTLFLTDISNS